MLQLCKPVLVACAAASMAVAAHANGSVSCVTQGVPARAACTIVPTRDGVFTITLAVEASGAAVRPAVLEAWLALDGQPCEGGAARRIGWQGGPGRLVLQCTERLQQGRVHQVVGEARGENTTSLGVAIRTQAQ